MANGPVTWAAVSALGERVARLEEHVSTMTASQTGRTTRRWMLVVGLITGLVCPVIVTSILVLLHLS